MVLLILAKSIGETKRKLLVFEETQGSIFFLLSEICPCLLSFSEDRIILAQFDIAEVLRHGVLQR